MCLFGVAVGPGGLGRNSIGSSCPGLEVGRCPVENDLAVVDEQDPVRDRLRRYGVLERIPEDRIYPTVGTAVSAYVRASGEPWTDWEEDARVDVPPATEPPAPPR